MLKSHCGKTENSNEISAKFPWKEMPQYAYLFSRSFNSRF